MCRLDAGSAPALRPYRRRLGWGPGDAAQRGSPAPPYAPCLAERSRNACPSQHTRPPSPHRDGWAQSSEFDLATVTAIPLFAGLQGGALEVVLNSARRLDVRAGETLVRRWHGTRHFYVIVAGSLEVRLGDERVRELRHGEFFGELAALDWGAGFGYARTATVAATTPSQLLVLTPAALSEVIRRAPSVASAIRTVASQRIKQT